MTASKQQELRALLRQGLNDRSRRSESIKRFQEIIWNTPETDDEGEEWVVFGDLAVDLDYYEPSPRRRREAPQLCGEEELEAVLRAGLKKLEAFEL